MNASIRLALLACLLSCAPALAQHTDWRTTFVPYDPWRVVDGQTNYVKLHGVEFCGQIMEIMHDGIRIEGEWGDLGRPYYPPLGWQDDDHRKVYNDYFVTNFPYQVFPGEIFGSDKHLMAWYTGDYTYKTVHGVTRTIRKLDYGTPSGPNPILLAAMQKQLQDAKEKRRESDLRTMAELQRYATNGDSSAEYSLAYHYMHGVGCDTNQIQGLFWLIKASAQGNIQASNDLQQIESSSTNSADFHP
ncbi:MAG TPA: hypothetical protein VH280_09710 [Verrucomicrobiae bacterium]|jgi:hypothetical protein|nr:hypothetical protein [Verrucomicrobiae bacterium]